MTNRLSASPTPSALWLVPGVMLLAALGPWPYGYYVLLRIVVCLASAALAWRLKVSGNPLQWIFVGIAILYNPVIRVPFEREVWTVLNVLSVVPFVWIGLKARSR